MKFNLNMQLTNAAFEVEVENEDRDMVPAPGYADGNEIARILRQLADKVDGCPLTDDFTACLKDINGNKVGKASVEVEGE